MEEGEIYEIMGYLSNPHARLRFDVQVPFNKETEFESTYQDLTNVPICAPGTGGYSVLGENVDKRSIQYRFSYTPSGMVPTALESIAKSGGAPVNQKRVSNKNLLLKMFENGFVLGDTPSKDRIISRIKPSYYVRFEFGYSAAFFDRSMKFDGFSSGFSAVYDTSQGPFSLFDEQPGQIVKSTRVGRSAAFRQIILQAYGSQCCVCNGSLVDLSGLYETEAAHVVPKSHNGSDDARNGIALCRKHHWAFDRGMFGIDDNYRVIVPDKILSIAENASLRHHNGSLIQCPDENAMPHSSALDWHRNNILCES